MRADGGGRRVQRCDRVSVQDWENVGVRSEGWKCWKWDCDETELRRTVNVEEHDVPRGEGTGGIQERCCAI